MEVNPLIRSRHLKTAEAEGLRKLQLAVTVGTGEIVASDLTSSIDTRRSSAEA
jgi:hypothetical protein